jgi:hypothetical protein
LLKCSYNTAMSVLVEGCTGESRVVVHDENKPLGQRDMKVTEVEQVEGAIKQNGVTLRCQNFDVYPEPTWAALNWVGGVVCGRCNDLCSRHVRVQ